MSTAAQVSAAIYTKLSADVTVAGLVATRIYPVNVPQGAALPYVVFQQISADVDATHTGAAGATHRLYQFACFAAGYEAALALRDAVIAALDGVALSNGEVPTLDEERDGSLDDALEAYRADADFLI